MTPTALHWRQKNSKSTGKIQNIEKLDSSFLAKVRKSLWSKSTNGEKDKMTAEQLKKDTQNRLETIFHVRTRLDDLAEHKRQCIIGKSMNFCF